MDDSSRPPALASFWFGMVASVTSIVLASPLRNTSSFTKEFGAMTEIWRASSRESFTEAPLTAVMTSPDLMPALAAGVSGWASSTSAPSAFFRPRLSAMDGVTG